MPHFPRIKSDTNKPNDDMSRQIFGELSHLNSEQLHYLRKLSKGVLQQFPQSSRQNMITAIQKEAVNVSGDDNQLTREIDQLKKGCQLLIDKNNQRIHQFKDKMTSIHKMTVFMAHQRHGLIIRVIDRVEQNNKLTIEINQLLGQDSSLQPCDRRQHVRRRGRRGHDRSLCAYQHVPIGANPLNAKVQKFINQFVAYLNWRYDLSDDLVIQRTQLNVQFDLLVEKSRQLKTFVQVEENAKRENIEIMSRQICSLRHELMSLGTRNHELTAIKKNYELRCFKCKVGRMD